MEEIRRYYDKQITLEEMMEHQVKELKAQKETMLLKEQLCEDIKTSHTPLIPYTVDQYQEVMVHRKEKLPYQHAGSLISCWGEKHSSRKQIMKFYLLLFPIVFLFGFLFTYTILENIKNCLTPASSYSMNVPAAIITLLILVVSIYYDYHLGSLLPSELYEFREKGIYYVNKDTQISRFEIRKAAREGTIEDHFDFASYEDIKLFKVGFHAFGRTPINGANIYSVDFRIFTTWDEMIHIDVGILGTSDEMVRLTAEILKEHAQKINDPYHILDHLSLEREAFYHYLDQIWWKKEYARVNKA